MKLWLMRFSFPNDKWLKSRKYDHFYVLFREEPSVVNGKFLPVGVGITIDPPKASKLLEGKELKEGQVAELDVEISAAFRVPAEKYLTRVLSE